MPTFTAPDGRVVEIRGDATSGPQFFVDGELLGSGTLTRPGGLAGTSQGASRNTIQNASALDQLQAMGLTPEQNPGAQAQLDQSAAFGLGQSQLAQTQAAGGNPLQHPAFAGFNPFLTFGASAAGGAPFLQPPGFSDMSVPAPQPSLGQLIQQSLPPEIFSDPAMQNLIATVVAIFEAMQGITGGVQNAA